ncbi:hypothetical protein ON010_g17182 [Phytophthora cinnamomi]|nr:hypothetical protein ON010_g17182 [Phytophthora cinnamomi]
MVHATPFVVTEYCDKGPLDTFLRQDGANRYRNSLDILALKDNRLVNDTAAVAGIDITNAVRYLAPECVKGLLPNTKSDIYSFGMTIYQTLIGESPYSDITSDEELRTCTLYGELPSHVESISDSAWEFGTQCCDPAPDRRPTMEKVTVRLKH